MKIQRIWKILRKSKFHILYIYLFMYSLKVTGLDCDTPRYWLTDNSWKMNPHCIVLEHDREKYYPQ